MKLSRIKRRSSGPLILELTPLIDVVFLLLIFFLVATSFEDVKSGIKIDLPTSTIRELKEIKEIQITINTKKELVLIYKEKGIASEEKVTKNNLKKLLSGKISESKEKNVLISADKNIDYGFVIEIMTIAKEAGASSLDIDTTSIKK
ncbi:MAG: ExbD/TolR family protein [Fusobacteriaceae bacterium]